MRRETTAIKRRKHVEVKTSRTGQAKMYALMFVCLVVVIAGFFLAARQHFSSMDYGMRNSKLRKQLDDLESEKRRLLLAREISLSPAEIKKAAQKLRIDGSLDALPQMASITSSSNSTGSPLDSQKNVASSSPKYIVRTAYIESSTKPQNASQAKVETTEKERKEKSSAAAIILVR